MARRAESLVLVELADAWPLFAAVTPPFGPGDEGYHPGPRPQPKEPGPVKPDYVPPPRDNE